MKNMNQQERAELAQHARSRIADGADPDHWVHIVGEGADAYTSTPLAALEPGLTARYFRLGDVAQWDARQQPQQTAQGTRGPC